MCVVVCRVDEDTEQDTISSPDYIRTYESLPVSPELRVETPIDRVRLQVGDGALIETARSEIRIRFYSSV